MSKKKHFSAEIHEKTKNTTAEWRKIRRRFLIVCEGKETEPNYFKSFALRDYVEVLTHGGKGSPSQVVKKALELRENTKQKPYDAVWAVFDKDNFTDFNQAITTAHNEGLDCAWSNEAFELWFVYHFENPTTPISRHEYGTKISTLVRKGAKAHRILVIRKMR